MLNILTLMFPIVSPLRGGRCIFLIRNLLCSHWLVLTGQEIRRCLFTSPCSKPSVILLIYHLSSPSVRTAHLFFSGRLAYCEAKIITFKLDDMALLACFSPEIYIRLVATFLSLRQEIQVSYILPG